MVKTGVSPAWAVSGDPHCSVAREERQALPFALLCSIQAREAIWLFLAITPLSLWVACLPCLQADLILVPSNGSSYWTLIGLKTHWNWGKWRMGLFVPHPQHFVPFLSSRSNPLVFLSVPLFKISWTYILVEWRIQILSNDVYHWLSQKKKKNPRVTGFWTSKSLSLSVTHTQWDRLKNQKPGFLGIIRNKSNIA